MCIAKDSKKISKYAIILIFLTAVVKITLFSFSQNPVVYVAGDGSGDFNCNGKDDHIQINRALEFVAENPGFDTVCLKGPFTYVINDTLLIGNNTILEGDSIATVKLADNASWPKDKPMIAQMEGSGNNDITIRNFEIDGNREGNTNIESGKGYYNLIHLKYSENIKVYDMYLHDNHGDGLKVEQSSNIQYYNNEIYSLGHDGLYAIYCSNVEAYNNSITCRINSGLRIYNTNHVKFYDNVITMIPGSGSVGIEIEKYGNAGAMDKIEIYGNTIYETRGAGIWIMAEGASYPVEAAKVHIHNNVIYGTGIRDAATYSGGIVIGGFNSLIENNVIDGAHGAGISYNELHNDAPGSGYVGVVRNNIIRNTEPHTSAGDGYGVYNKMNTVHSFVLEKNCLYNNSGGDYKYTGSSTDIHIDPLFVDRTAQDYPIKIISWGTDGETCGAGTGTIHPLEAGYLDPNRSSGQEENRSDSGLYRYTGFASRFDDTVSGLGDAASKGVTLLLNAIEKIDSWKINTASTTPKTFSPTLLSDNRLREMSPNSVLPDNYYIDVGHRADAGRYRDLIKFELDALNTTGRLEKATLLLFWYYPEDEPRTYDTVLEVYRPTEWCEEHVNWNQREEKIPWEHAGGDWFDKNNEPQGDVPYAAVTIEGSKLSDNRYYELDVTELVQDYVDGKYENTGFLLKAFEEERNYIAFYSSDWENPNQQPKLIIEYADNRLK